MNDSEEVARPIIYCWTDGSTCPTNPGPGGWAFLLQSPLSKNGAELLRNGSFPYTSNIRMELIAVLRGLQALKKPSKVYLQTDSQYIIDGFRNLRRDRLLKSHYDVWGLILHLSQIHSVAAIKVKGHSGIPNNERVDVAAKEAARGQLGDPYMTPTEIMMSEVLEKQKMVEKRTWEI